MPHLVILATLTLALTGLRRFELPGLRWRHVKLVEGTLRVEVSKSEEGERLVALPASLVSALMEQFTSSPYRADDNYVFCHPERGSKLATKGYLHLAGVVFHDDATALERRLMGVEDPGRSQPETAAVSEKS